MNYKRALLFGLYVYLTSFIIFGLLSVLPWFSISAGQEASMGLYLINWIVTIPLILLWAKWYFHQEEISVRNGFIIGLIAILVGLFFDGVFYALTIAAGESTEIFDSMYTDWKFYVSILEVILLTTYAGFEFDSTFTAVPKKSKKKRKKS